jgi:glycosyltransferase involved in cell wall biosynthesis
MGQPKASVIIPAYDRADYLKPCIQSVLDQTFTDFELIVVDNGSTDHTRETVYGFGNKVRYFYKEHGPAATSRNWGIARARGPYIALLDSDDLWHRDRLERTVRALDEHQNAGLVHGIAELMDQNGKLIEEESRGLKVAYARQKQTKSLYFDLLKEYAIFSSTVVFRKRCLDQVGLYDESLLSYEDYDWYLRFALKFPFYQMGGSPLASIRRHRGNITQQYNPQENARIYIGILEKHLAEFAREESEPGKRVLRANILTKLAEFYWAVGEKKQVKQKLGEAFRLDRSLLWDWRSVAHLVFSL